jgi:hypothetical protein
MFPIDPRTGLACEIALSHPLYAANSMTVTNEGAVRTGEFTVYVTRASRGLVSVVLLDGISGKGTVRDLAASEIDAPFSATVVDGALFVTDSQLGRDPDFGGAGDIVSPFQISYLGPQYLSGRQLEPGPASAIIANP